jgi:SSS family solute:Na+ symporter
MINVRSALDAWWNLAGIASGGMLGLFLLGFLSRRASNTAAAVGTGAGIAVILWMTFSPQWTGALEPWRSSFHPLLTMVLGTLVILGVGLVVSSLAGRAKTPGA